MYIDDFNEELANQNLFYFMDFLKYHNIFYYFENNNPRCFKFLDDSNYAINSGLGFELLDDIIFLNNTCEHIETKKEILKVFFDYICIVGKNKSSNMIIDYERFVKFKKIKTK